VARVAAVTALALAVLGVTIAASAGMEDDAGPRPPAALPGPADGKVYPALRATAELALPGGRPTDAAVGVYPALSDPATLAFPSPAAVDAARRYAAKREGRVSFAVADLRGAIDGEAVDRTYASASLVKPLLLVAHLERAARDGRAISTTERSRLDPMIRVSDNDSATSTYRRLGPAPVEQLARRAGMRSFRIGGEWAAARVTAADQARFFLALDRLVPGVHRTYARTLLSSVVPEHSWGIPAAARPTWRVFFKGGWRPQDRGELVHQAALLERGARRISIAVLTDRNPTEAYGEATVRGIAARLLRAPPAASPPARKAGELAPVEELDGYRPPPQRPLRPLPEV
jgi:Beta-lactamase enzyme family